jgi:hypothetical protein
MQPSPAEIARTLAFGRLPAAIRTTVAADLPAAGCARRSPVPTEEVRHATDDTGRVLVLVPSDGDLARALRPDGDTPARLLLDVVDQPPMPDSPSWGRLRLIGPAAALTGAAARAAAGDFAAVHPSGDLFDLGDRFTLYRVEPTAIRLDPADGASVTIDPADFAAARADPLHVGERELLVDLAAHHAGEIGRFVLSRLGDLVAPLGSGYDLPRIVRLDRYGFVVCIRAGADRYRARLGFGAPLRDQAELRRVLHAVLRTGR